ncbi:hypothetical protein THAOC_22939, partial [Thalassiosira oceanica]
MASRTVPSSDHPRPPRREGRREEEEVPGPSYDISCTVPSIPPRKILPPSVPATDRTGVPSVGTAYLVGTSRIGAQRHLLRRRHGEAPPDRVGEYARAGTDEAHGHDALSRRDGHGAVVLVARRPRGVSRTEGPVTDAGAEGGRVAPQVQRVVDAKPRQSGVREESHEASQPRPPGLLGERRGQGHGPVEDEPGGVTSLPRQFTPVAVRSGRRGGGRRGLPRAL